MPITCNSVYADRRAGNEPVSFTLICTFMPSADFTDLCRKVYFATDDFSLATFIVVNNGLYYLLHEHWTRVSKDEAEADRLRHYHYMCRDNLETALANLPMFLPARAENIRALIIGVRGFPILDCQAPTAY